MSDNTPQPHNVEKYVQLLDAEGQEQLFAHVVLNGKDSDVGLTDLSKLHRYELEDLHQSMLAVDFLIWKEMRRRNVKTGRDGKDYEQPELPF